MSKIEVLKFGSSVLHAPGELHVAVDEIYRRWRSGCRVLAVVSAFEGVTDQLIREAAQIFGTDCPEATAAYVATGEQKTAALLVGSLVRSGIPTRLVEPREIDLVAAGSALDSAPRRVNVWALEGFWRAAPILVLPGFFGIDHQGHTTLFGRGGTDMSALFLASELKGSCRLLKDVNGVFDADPASKATAHRFTALSWTTAIEVSGPLIQPKALHYARIRTLPFHVGRPNESAGTHVGKTADEWAPPTPPTPPLRVALLGCGVVGRGVYESLKRYPTRFEIRHVLVRDLAKYADIPEATNDWSLGLQDSIDLVIECIGGVESAFLLIANALSAKKFVVTANKALVAAHWPALSHYARGSKRLLWYSAAVGGALPILETLATLDAPVREIRGIINGTCGFVLDALVSGKTRPEAIALAQAAGFAEADPARDLSGADSADKLALMMEAAFGQWMAPASIPTRGIDRDLSDPRGIKLIARAQVAPDGMTASVAPELPTQGSFLALARAAENRIEIELKCGSVIRLRGQGAGRWPTAVSVMGDVHEVARVVETRGVEESSPSPLRQSNVVKFTAVNATR